jgi:hypothetical protein
MPTRLEMLKAGYQHRSHQNKSDREVLFMGLQDRDHMRERWRDRSPITPPPATRSAPPETSGSITLYHCKAYSGGTFWANTHCNQHQALIDRMVDVSARLAFSQQVEMAEGNRRAGAAPQSAPQGVLAAPVVSDSGECDVLERQIQHWDAMARQPQSAQMQDWTHVEWHKMRDRQRALRCQHWQKIPHRNIMIDSPWATGRVTTYQQDRQWCCAPGRGVAGLAPPWRFIRSLTAW